ncbi:hypothetical protein D6851_15980 [Altericroceibacterium spongiae]|uniref:Uncharacterized protein n=2 Tax=Altericroceibacterium spongiae TaxID=2320269 RepID=A0A420EAF4_9SPHN|nr:hypothetical protein D6851_15980 [Altericroceibacterium spongiae]
MGYEAIYLLLQALLVLVIGAGGPLLLGANGNFAVLVAVLLIYSLAIHAWLFRGGRIGKRRTDVALRWASLVRLSPVIVRLCRDTDLLALFSKAMVKRR